MPSEIGAPFTPVSEAENELMEDAKQPEDKKILFATDRKSMDTDFYLQGNPISLIAINIASYMGGRANPWDSSDMAVVNRQSKRLSVKEMPRF